MDGVLSINLLSNSMTFESEVALQTDTIRLLYTGYYNEHVQVHNLLYSGNKT